MAQDPYAELGVARSAGQEDIRKAFRKLAKELHPDRNPGDKAAEERFKRVTGAFDILGDPEKKAKFDRGEIDADGRETMRNPFGGGGGGNPFGGGGPFGGRGGGFEGADFEDILGEVFGARGGGGFRPGGFSPKGQDLRVRIEIDLEDAIRGATKRVAFSDGRTVDITIPKGAAEGQVLRLKGQGGPGRGGVKGDALVELTIRPHPLYRREGDDLHMDLPVSIPDAVLGAKVEAPTPDGNVTLTVPKGSNAGSMLRLKGRGAINPGSNRRGDLLARLVLTLPETPDSELEKFAQTWREKRPYQPRRKG